MLTIRAEQMDAFERESARQFAIRLAAEIREDHPSSVQNLSDDELRELILEGVERAEDYGLESDADVATFVELLFVVGWYFDRYPLCQSFLQEEDYTPAERIEYLLDSATEEDWAAAAEYSEKELDVEIHERNIHARS